MRFYPSGRHRARTVAGDATVVMLVAVFAWLGLWVHDSIAGLATLARGVQDAGSGIERAGRDTATAVEDVADAAADTAGEAPIVGGEASERLRDAGRRSADALEGEGRATGGRVVERGARAEDRALAAARLLGWVTFLIPTAVLLSRAVPPRLRQMRMLTVVDAALAPDGRPEGERARMLARRAAFSLPYTTLVRHSPDPIGDLVAGRHDRLLAALAEDAGMPPFRLAAGATPPRAARDEASRGRRRSRAKWR